MANAEVKILHLEDDPFDADLVKDSLCSAGVSCKIQRVQSRAEFEGALLSGDYDLVLADYNLPAYDGMAALHFARQYWPEVPFIFVSGAIGEDAAIDALTQGAVDYVLKQKLSRLVPAVRRALQEAENRRQRRRAEVELAEERNLLRTLIDNMPDFVYIKDTKSRFLLSNPAHLAVLRAASMADIAGKTDFDIFPPELAAQYYADEQAVIQSGQPLINLEETVITPQGQPRWLLTSKLPLHNAEGKLIGLFGISRDIDDRKKGEQKLSAIYQVAQRLQMVQSSASLSQEIIRILQTVVEYARASVLLIDEPTGRLLPYADSIQENDLAEGTVEAAWLESLDLWLGKGIVGWVAQNGQPVRVGEISRDARYLEAQKGISSELCVPLCIGEQVIGVLNVETPRKDAYSEADQRLLETIGAQIAIAIQNARLFEETRQRMAELEAIASLSAALRSAYVRSEMAPIILGKLAEVMSADSTALAIRNPLSGETVIELSRGALEQMSGARLPPGSGIFGQVIDSGQVFQSNKMQSIPGIEHHPEFANLLAGVCVPLIAQEESLGALWVGRATRPFSPAEIGLLTSIANIVAGSIRRAILDEQTGRRLQRLQALNEIETTIAGNFELRPALNVLINQVMDQLHVDAASVLLYNPRTQLLAYAAGRGFRTRRHEFTSLRMGEGLPGQAALTRQVVQASHPPSGWPTGWRSGIAAADEGIVDYLAAPLIAKGAIKGVLEIFYRSPVEKDPETLDFLSTLARQIAIAIDDAELFEGLQRANADLVVAYDTTIEGWSHALDLRDQETEGHTRRVTDMTLRLAQALGIPEEQWGHIRRGALLHDIGKMAIPDAVLLKPGPLTAEERAIMREHPRYAYELLSPIAYLTPALDIPYCHHEKWDGSGYPRGLRGEEIPLAARIFSIVDVWDALRSTRYYRTAQPEDEVRQYLRSQSGAFFDPGVVDVFLGILEESEV